MPAPAYRFATATPLRHTDGFGGTPFVRRGVLIALTEIALEDYDLEAAVPSHRDVLRFQASSEILSPAPLRRDDGAVVRLRCSQLRRGRLTFECEVAAASSGEAVARMTHRYAYVNVQSERAEMPGDWLAIVEAIRGYEPAIEIDERARA